LIVSLVNLHVNRMSRSGASRTVRDRCIMMSVESFIMTNEYYMIKCMLLIFLSSVTHIHVNFTYKSRLALVRGSDTQIYHIVDIK